MSSLSPCMSANPIWEPMYRPPSLATSALILSVGAPATGVKTPSSGLSLNSPLSVPTYRIPPVTAIPWMVANASDSYDLKLAWSSSESAGTMARPPSVPIYSVPSFSNREWIATFGRPSSK